ncbi:IS1182 family transposase [bacterium]|nr:IS1182 family transposase [bacterium]
MSYNFIAYNRDQYFLLPPNIREWLPDNHLAWFILDAVEQMDLSRFFENYRRDGWGGKSFHPAMLVSLLLYAYTRGERSSRKIEALCEHDVAYRVITANMIPDHTTICRFRQHHQSALKHLFLDVLKLCKSAGLLKVGAVSLDGTKMKANASLSSNRTLKHLSAEIEKMLKEAAVTDTREDAQYGKENRGDELPEDLRHHEDRVKRLQACKKRLDEEDQQRRDKQAKKVQSWNAKADKKKKRGKKPKPPDRLPPLKTKANTTDPDSRAMKIRNGFVQGYNAQAVVTEDQVILACGLTQEVNDVKQLHPMLDMTQTNCQVAGIEEDIEIWLADAGYGSEANFTHANPDGPELFIPVTSDSKRSKQLKKQGPPRGRIPKDFTVTQRMERKLRTKRGQEIYRQRGWMSEGVFGQIKDGRNTDSFARRGLTPCDSEWTFICACHNLLKLWNHTKSCPN